MPEKRALGRRHFLLTATAGASVSGPSVLTSPIWAATNVGAVNSQSVHPLLIRNAHNALIHVVVEVQQPDAHATSFTFSLRGTDELKDLETLRLFYSRDKQPRVLDQVRNGSSFSGDRRALLAELTGTPFGRPSESAAEVKFRGSQALRQGTNVFWLSCKLRPTVDLSHKVDARCTAIETSAGMVTPRDETAGVRKRIGIALRRHNDDGMHTYRIPALATTPKGTLLCVYNVRRRKRRDLQEDIDIGLSRSA